MKIKLYGTRGSIPVCEAESQEFGGNTTCVLVEAKDKIFILDAGTGIRALGKELAQKTSGSCENVFIGFLIFIGITSKDFHFSCRHMIIKENLQLPQLVKKQSSRT